jgi:hypothetical protein
MTNGNLADIAEQLPYPLGLKLQAVRAGARDRADEAGAAELPFAIAAFSGLALRLAALVALHAYVRNGATDNEINHFVVDKLRTPADGTWHELVRKLRAKVQRDPHAALVYAWFDHDAQIPVRGGDWEAPGWCVSPRLRQWLEGRPVKAPAKLPTVDKTLEELVAFRNKLVHGEVPDDELLDTALLRVEAVARGAASALAGATLQVRDGQQAWRVMGHVPQPLASVPVDLEDQVPTLVFQNELPPLPLAPLLRFVPGAASDVVAIDELFFVNAAALDRLQYVGFRRGAQADGKALGTYDAFKAFWQRIPVTPSPRDPLLRFDDLADFHAQLFVGRGEVLDEIGAQLVVADQPGRYLELRALAGMGKSAILAMLYARQLPKLAGRTVPGAPVGVPGDGAWVFHFCAQTEGREHALVALRSVMAQLCDAAAIDRSKWLSNELKELKEERLPGLLAEVARKCGTVVVVLDALDESVGADEEALGGCLPEVLPEGVTVLLSWRVDRQGKAPRIDRQLARLPASVRVPLLTANPLAGLAQEHVGRFLERVCETQGLTRGAPETTAAAVWQAATTDSDGADPFYLRFVAEAVRDGRVDLERAETVPASLEDAFEGQWLALPRERNFLAQRALLLLGILREYGDDDLLAELISRDPDYGGPVTAQDIAITRQSLGKLLVYDSERYGLFHDRFRRFLVGEQKDPIAEALGTA